MHRLTPLRPHFFTALMLSLGALGGLVATLLPVPMPFLLGSLAVTGGTVALAEAHFPAGYRFPQPFRLIFIATIGVMIGAQVNPELLAQAPSMLISFIGVVVFVIGAHGLNYRILRRLGGYDPATAFYGAAPGGLIESITLGEAAGADVRVLTLLQFLRIVLVLTLVPVALSFWKGTPVGSAAGLSLSRGAAGGMDIVLVLLIGLAGLALGRGLRLPAGQLTGPLLVAAVVAGSGLLEINAPSWMIATAQVVLGTSLGLRFAGVNRRLLGKALGMSLVTVGGMFALGAVLALAVRGLTGLPFDVLVISYAPGGVTEMSLIAVSLAANPALVTLHHLFRITLTVVELGLVRRLGLVRLE